MNEKVKRKYVKKLRIDIVKLNFLYDVDEVAQNELKVLRREPA